MLYLTGQGVPQDMISAHMWYSISVESGNADARGFLEDIAPGMNPEAIAEAERRKGVCVASGYKDCDQTK